MYKPIDMDSLKLNNNFKWVVTKDNFFTKEDVLVFKVTFDNGSWV